MDHAACFLLGVFLALLTAWLWAPAFVVPAQEPSAAPPLAYAVEHSTNERIDALMPDSEEVPRHVAVARAGEAYAMALGDLRESIVTSTGLPYDLAVEITDRGLRSLAVRNGP